MTQNRQVLLASRPQGAVSERNFRIVDVPLRAPADGEVLVRNEWLSLDPYMRGRMSDAKSYADPVEVGDVLVGGTVCEVISSRHPDHAAGDFVLSYSGWQTHALADGSRLRKLDPSVVPLSTALGVLGMPGFTAYAGLLEIGKPGAGETVVVAAATGPVGSAVGQIAQISGARAVGIAGGAEKCRALIEEFGFDAAVDHRAPDFRERLADAVPDGIDVYFENVGGEVGRAVLRHLNLYARIPVCGLVAGYNATKASEGPDRLDAFMGRVLTKSLTVRGFIQSEFEREHHAQFLDDMAGWVKNGQVRYREDVTVGLEHTVEAFNGMLAGRNFGKVVIQVDAPVDALG